MHITTLNKINSTSNIICTTPKKNKYNNYQIADSYSPSFKNKDLFDLAPKTIFSKINKSIQNQDNFLGKGSEGIVYKIEKTNFCIKLNILENKSKPFKIPHTITRDISIQDKINHIVAKLGENAVIMKKINGTPIDSPQMTIKNARQISKTIEKLPHSEILSLLKQISFAYQNNMKIDSMNTNVLLNDKNELKAIDFFRFSKHDKFDNEILPLYSIYTSLINKGTNKNQEKILAKKIIEVGLEELQPKTIPNFDIDDYDIFEFLDFLSDKNIYKPNEKFEYLLSETMLLKNKSMKSKNSEIINNQLRENIAKLKEYLNKVIKTNKNS